MMKRSNKMLTEAANIKPRELRRLKRIQAIESKKLRVPIKQVQMNAFPYFLKGGEKTFKIKGDPKTADGLYGEESYIAISRMQSDLFNKGFLKSLKKSGRFSMEGVYGPETHEAFEKAKKIGALLGNKEPEDEKNIRIRIKQLLTFMDSGVNKRQYKWALRLKGYLISLLRKSKPKPKPVEKETIKKVVKKAANDGKIEDSDVPRYIWWLSIQANAGNIAFDPERGEMRPIGDPAPITKKALDKIKDGDGPKYIDPFKKQNKPTSESKNYRVFEHYFEENNKNFPVLTKETLNCEKTLHKVIEILNSKG